MNNRYEIDIHTVFGASCGDGTHAFKFLKDTVLPEINNNKVITFDLSGVRIMNSSFSNALFGNIAKVFGKSALEKIRIKNARPIVKSEIKSSLAYGYSLSKQNLAA